MRLNMSRQGKRLIMIGMACYLIFLFYSIPATFLTGYLLPSVPAAGALQLSGVSGTVWTGEAYRTSYNRLHLGKLNWELSGWRLLLGNIAMDLNFAGNTTQGSAYLSVGLGGEVQAEDVRVNMSADMLTPLFYGMPISFNGEIKSNIEELRLEPGSMINARGRVLWREARLDTPQVIDLGDYLAILEPLNRGTKITINDNNRGPIETNLTIQLKGSGEYKVNGSLKARDQSQQHITEALRLIGRADNAGRYWLVRNGRLRGWKK